MKKYSFIPYESFSIKSDLTIFNIKAKNSIEVISKENKIINECFELKFKSDNKFQVNRKVLSGHYYNSFIPEIKGKIKESNQGVVVDVEFSIKDSVYTILYFMILVYLLILGASIRIVFLDSTSYILLIYISLVGFIVYLFLFISYNIESRLANFFLKKYFEGY